LNIDTYLACYDYVEYKEQQEISAFLDKNYDIYSLYLSLPILYKN